MKRTTVMLPQDLKMRALKSANMMGVSFGQLVRESLERALNDRDDILSEDSLFADDAVFRGDSPADLAKNHDSYLYGDRY